MTRADRSHLNTLSICHYVLAGLCFLFGGFAVLYLGLGILFLTDPPPQPNGPPGPEPEFFGWIMIGFAIVMLAFYWGLAIGLAVAGWCLRRRKWRPFCMVVAGLACLFQPLGTALGIFTFIVLLRPRVRAAFEPYDDEPADALSEFDTYHTD
jgi:hypothetical protein